MIYVKISGGGMGSQMFLYAFARAMSVKLQMPYILYADRRVIQSHIQFAFTLDKFNIENVQNIVFDLNINEIEGSVYYALGHFARTAILIK